MTDDVVTIPRKDARKWAGALRDAFDQLRGSAPLGLIGLADLLDPPVRSLRDEVAEELAAAHSDITPGDGQYLAAAVLAVVRKRIADLSWSDRNWDGYTPEEGYEAGRNDVIALLGGESDD